MSRTVALRAQLDACGDYFTIAARDVEYVDLPGGFTVGDLRFVSNVRDVTGLASKVETDWERAEP